MRVIKGETCRGICGFRTCLRAATGDWIVPIDADDVPEVDALGVMASTIASVPRRFRLLRGPPTIDAARSRYVRPGSINPQHRELIHLALVRVPSRSRPGPWRVRIRAPSSADWDSSTRFAQAGDDGCTHLTSYPLAQPRRVLEPSRDAESWTVVSTRACWSAWWRDNLHTRFEVAEYPIDRGAIEWWIRRRPIDPPSFGVVILGGNGRSSTEPIAGDLTLHKPWSRPRANRNS